MNIFCIGAGNMAKALVAPLAKKENVKLTFYSPSGVSAKTVAQEFGCLSSTELIESLEQCDICFLACKPQNLNSLAQEIARAIPKHILLVSLLAGKTFENLEDALSHNKLIRVMPNTPSLVGKGVSLMLHSKELIESEVSLVRDVLAYTSMVVPLETEEQFDRVTTVTGSGPAYLFEIARVFQNYIQLHGIEAEQARKLVSELFLGTAMMMDSQTESFETLRKNVTSKKGMTFEALEVLRKEHLPDIFAKALDAAYQRAQELKKV